jgi:hypothetical protein
MLQCIQRQKAAVPWYECLRSSMLNKHADTSHILAGVRVLMMFLPAAYAHRST